MNTIQINLLSTCLWDDDLIKHRGNENDLLASLWEAYQEYNLTAVLSTELQASSNSDEYVGSTGGDGDDRIVETNQKEGRCSD